MKTIEEIALSVAYKCFSDYADDRVTTLTFMTGKDEVLKFAEKLLTAWLEQQSQEPVAYMAPSGTCVTAEDVSYTPNLTDYYTIPLYAAPPAKVEQQSQEPVAHVLNRERCTVWWNDKFTDISQAPPKNTPLFLAPQTAIPEGMCLAPQTAIPEGMCLVPKEPTLEILESFWGEITHGDEEVACAMNAYFDMLKVAQKEQS